MTPFEIRNKEFRKVAFGYSPRDVVQYLDAVARVLERIQKQQKDLTDELVHWRERESELEKTKEKALVDAENVLAKAKEKAIEIRAGVEEWLATVIAEAEEARRQKEVYVNSVKAVLDQHYALLREEGECVNPTEKLEKLLQQNSPGA